MNQDLLSTAGAALSLIDLLVALAIAFAIGLGLAFVYRVTFRGFTYERGFLVTLVTMPSIVAVVMAFIANNLALSLGMVGALSIIRFRTVIKDSRDMVFLFWTIAVGLGCGTYNWAAITLASVAIALALLTLHFVGYGTARRRDYVLVLKGEKEDALENARGVVRNALPTARLRSQEHDEEGWELVLELTVRATEPADHLDWMRALRAVDGVTQVSLLAPQLALPV